MPFVEHNGKKILFIHIPKAGGTSVETWLESLGPLRFHTVGTPPALRCTPQHLRMSDFRAMFGEGFFDYAFAISRNPYARLESEFRMQMVNRSKSTIFRRQPRFSQWLEASLERAARDPWVADNHFRPQWDFVGTGVEVFRLEQGMDAIMAKVAERLDLPLPPRAERALATGKAEIEIAWDEVDRMRVQERFARDFELFGYDPAAH